VSIEDFIDLGKDSLMGQSMSVGLKKSKELAEAKATIQQLQDQLADSMNVYRDLDKEHQQLQARVRELEGAISDVKSLPRWDLVHGSQYEDDTGMHPEAFGEWVAYEDIEQALHPPAEKEE